MKKRAVIAALAAVLLLTGCSGSAEAGASEVVTVVGTASVTVETEGIVPEACDPGEETAPVESQPERFLLTFAGDCTLGGTPSNYYAQCGFVKTVGEDYGHPFRNVIGYFENDDFTMVNLEGPLCDSGYPVQKRFTFRGPTAFTAILTQNSVEAVSLANNHTLDYGQTGYASTREVLDEAGVPYVERDSTRLIRTERGLTIGLYGMVYYKLDVEDMVREVRDLRQQGADIVIVAPHWGREYTYLPTAEQEQVAHAAIDAGADIVAGTHPHVLQPVESYGEGIIYYSLGNFSFGGNSNPEDYDTVLLQQEILRWPDGSVELGDVTLIPACVSSIEGVNNYQPTPYEAGSAEYDRVLRKLDGSFGAAN